MKKRSDGRYMKYVTIAPGQRKAFYSSEKTEAKANADIQRQMLNYAAEAHADTHNFLSIAEKMIEDKERTVSHTTVECYKNALNHLDAFFDCNIEEISPSMLQKLLNRMAAQQYSYSLISKTKIVFGLVLNYAILHDINVNNFMSSIRVPRVERKKVESVDDYIIDRITKNVDISAFGMWPMILLYTGMRRGELAALQRKDIDFNNDVIHIRRSVEFINNQPKLKNMPKTTNSVRDVPILDVLRPYLQSHCSTCKANDFIFGGDNPLTLTMIKKRWKSYCKTIDADIHQHQLRHAYAKILYRAGVDAKTAQGLLGHADIQTTMNIYTDFSDDVTNKSVGLINSFIGSGAMLS